jgi:hypothetical protein
MLGLLEARSVHAHLVSDLGLMFKQAEEAAAASPAGAGPAPKTPPLGFTLRKFETDYQVGGATEASPSGSAGPPTVGGRGNAPGGETPGPASTEKPAIPPGEDPALANQPRVSCRLTVTTMQPDSFNFMLKTMDNWLRTHVRRDGVPYVIATSSEPLFKITDEQSVNAEPTPPPGGGELAPGGRGLAERGAGEGRGEAPQPRIIGRPEGSGGGSPPTDTGPSIASNPEVERMAPLNQLRPPEEAGKRTTLELRWQVIILPAPAKKPAGGGA